MKRYLIRIENNCNGCELIHIYGDTPTRPFSIAHNLWNYAKPGHAARRLEMLAQSWEKNGLTVKRIYGSIVDMPTKGNEFNAAATIHEYK